MESKPFSKLSIVQANVKTNRLEIGMNNNDITEIGIESISPYVKTKLSKTECYNYKKKSLIVSPQINSKFSPSVSIRESPVIKQRSKPWLKNDYIKSNLKDKKDFLNKFQKNQINHINQINHMNHLNQKKAKISDNVEVINKDSKTVNIMARYSSDSPISEEMIKNGSMDNFSFKLFEHVEKINSKFKHFNSDMSENEVSKNALVEMESEKHVRIPKKNKKHHRVNKEGLQRKDSFKKEGKEGTIELKIFNKFRENEDFTGHVIKRSAFLEKGFSSLYF